MSDRKNGLTTEGFSSRPILRQTRFLQSSAIAGSRRLRVYLPIFYQELTKPV